MSVDRVEREAYILDLLAKDGSLSVAALSRDLGVSDVTIRGQLAALEERGLLLRTRGGAQATSLRHVLERQREHEDEKERVARAAAALVRDDDRINQYARHFHLTRIQRSALGDTLDLRDHYATRVACRHRNRERL